MPLPEVGADIAPRTLLLLLDGSRVLLARKKRGFGRGRIVGIGGGVEAGETLEQTAVREMIEEASITPLDPLRVARLDFVFAGSTPVWKLRVEVFTACAWQGEPRASDEVAPAWFERAAIPYHEMWDDARLWLPLVLAGQRFSARFELGSDDEVVRHAFEPWGEQPPSD